MIFEALKRLITSHASKSVSIFQYSNHDDFGRLWRELGSAPSRPLPWPILVIVWDGLPAGDSVESPFRPEEWLTPWDWALAMSMHLCRHPDVIPKEGYRCLVFDLLPLTSGSGGRQRFKRAHAFVPWVRWYRPLDTPRAVAADYEQFFCDVLAFPNSFPALDRKIADTQAQGLKDIAQAWSDMIAVSTDRHAISNLVAPVLLLASMGDKGPFRWEGHHSRALRTLLGAVGFLPPSGAVALHAPWLVPGMLSHQHTEVIRRGLNVILLDDLSDIGWGDFLNRALGRMEGLQVRCVSKVDDQVFGEECNRSLVEIVQARLSDPKKWHITRPMQLFGGQPNLLLLDLRLFSTRSVDEEALFLGKLLELARKVPSTGSKARALWPGFERTELQDIQTWIEDPKRNRETPAYLAALTLLPRLLALADPTLPVVLFSSTGQRMVIERLNPYPNIITKFEKPRFTGHTTEPIVADMRANFMTAFKEALDIAYGRLVCEYIAADSLVTVPASTIRDPFIEIYIDESGRPEEKVFCVGGLVLIYLNELHANDFNKALVQSGLAIGVDEDLINLSSGGLALDPDLQIKYGVNLKKRPSDPVRKAFDPFDKLCRDQGVQRVAFVLFKGLRTPQLTSGIHPLLDPESLDNLYRSLIKFALELILFELLPQFQFPGSSKIFVHVATRLRHKGTIPLEEWEELPRRFGVKQSSFASGEDYFYSIGSDSTYPIVTDVLQHRRSEKSLATFRVVGARGVELLDFDEVRDRFNRAKSNPEKLYKFRAKLLNSDLPRQSHYFADLVAHYAAQMTLRNHPELVPWKDAWFHAGFWDGIDERLLAVVEACRHEDAERHVGGIVLGHSAGLMSSVAPTGVARWAKSRLSGSVAKLSGPEFIELCQRLALVSNL